VITTTRVVGLAAVVAIAIVGAVWVSTSSGRAGEHPIAVPATAALAPPLPHHTFEGTLREQSAQAMRGLSSHGYSVFVSHHPDGSVARISTLAPEELIDSYFGAFDSAYTIERTEVTGQLGSENT